jgi:hypothetical protein
MHRSFVGRPSLCEGLRFLRMTAWEGGGGQGGMTGSTGGGRECPPYMFCLDLALRYFVSFLYNLNGFMEPLRTGIVRGGFLCLGRFWGKRKVPRLRISFASRI